jgi:predicted nucleotidyltransferase
MGFLDYDRNQLDRLCREYHVTRLAVFGSVMRGEETPTSDLDLLIEFEPQKKPGLIRFFGLQNKFEQIFGRPVDLNTAGFLNIAFRDRVVQNARAIYAR